MHLSTLDATRLPLLLLGHPGAGKSVLTKILAARLPGSGYTAVYVPLRHVTADAPVYRQVQEALDLTTHGRVDWADLTDQSEGTLRVVLLDGLDELLQAAEHSRSAFLHDVVEFQRREAEQLRPVAVVVTTRSVVADRVDIAAGTTVIKLAEFTGTQVDQWRETWNRTNGSGIASGAVRPLTAEAVVRCGPLARQPLLLLMVAMYEADPSTSPIETGLSETALYQRLLENFAQREASRTRSGRRDLVKAARDQLRQLAIAALAMVNRGRQYVTEAELDRDLTALGMAKRDIFARFFFISTAQATVHAERTLRSYEFLHSTFGEYLVAREIVDVLLDTADRATSRRGPVTPDDSLLFALLSHHCIAARRSIVSFALGIFAGLPAADRDAVASLLTTLIRGCRTRQGSGQYTGYQPTETDHVREIAVYSVNLVLLRLGAAHPLVRLDQLWPEEPEAMWRSTVQLWRASLDESNWLAVLSLISMSDGVLLLAMTALSDRYREVSYAKLIGDRELAMNLAMGQTVRTNPAFVFDDTVDADETFARWIIPAAVLAIPESAALSEEQLQALVRSSGRKAHDILQICAQVLRSRGDILPYDTTLSLVRVVAGFPEYFEDAIAAAVLTNPKLLKDVPEIRAPDYYSDRVAAWLVVGHRFNDGERQPESDLLDSLAAALKARLASWPW
ncbi:NACHT domain-containing protein [Actinocrispum wychmicini]|uniref:AAA+ ATPase domain-containing protein n=1 Tax=Actinocrispum wychmicini TaxID=1213861 RepID=A0A4R2J5S7_9PSEU|nr:hypothetical protein EV192_110304 [Actinocrispum wychmicini]